MDIETAKRIAIDDFLESLGHSPVRRKGNVLWYLSPLREERTASFKVDTGLSCWYDFGLGRGGGIMALARELYRSNDITYLLGCIGRSAPGSVLRFVPNVKKQKQPPTFTKIGVFPLNSPALLAYLCERKIDTDVAREECVEVHYTCNCKRYYAIGFRNRSGGYELRNRWFKGCIAPKDISYTRQDGDNENKICLVFEGFIDYLSFLTLMKHDRLSCLDATECDFIVLNSVANIGKVLPLLREYGKTVCLLDNDAAGHNAFASLSKALNGKAEDLSPLYGNFKDLNEHIQSLSNLSNNIFNTKIVKIIEYL
mgnify:FL=1|jgi:hypothetical protein